MSQWKWHINSKSVAECPEELDIGVPSSSLLKILERVGGDVQVVGRVTIRGVHLGPKWSSVRVETRFIGLLSLAAFLLTVALPLAVDAGVAVLVGVIAGTLHPGVILSVVL